MTKMSPILLVAIAAIYVKLTVVDSSHSSNTFVKFLPGFHGPLPFHLETGYVEVGEPGEVLNVFYYFVESERNPKEDPIVLWFTGGPGCSSFSAFHSLGPLQFIKQDYDGSLPKFFHNPHRWTKTCNMIFVDLPVGTGFSYPKTHTGDTNQVQHAVQFLRKWLVDHEQYLLSPIYIGGESYSGKTVPAYSMHIVESNEKGLKPWINFQGYIIGNPLFVVESYKMNTFRMKFAHGIGLIPDELYKSLMNDCGEKDRHYGDSSNVNCLLSMQKYNKSIEKISTNNILDPITCKQQNSPTRRSLHENPKLFLKPSQCRYYEYLLMGYWANDDEVRRALGIREGTVKNWKRCSYALSYESDIPSSYMFIVQLSSKGYRSLIYSGDHDILSPHLATQAWIRSLNYSIVEDWRPWLVEDDVGGYTRTYSNKMTFATVKGGGHVAPDYKPKECHAMFERWISKNPL